MLSYTGLRNKYGVYTNNTTTANLANGDGYIAEATRRILGSFDWPFLESQDTAQVTVAGQQYYPVPVDFDKNINVTVTIGSVLWHPREETNRDRWDRINYALNVTSNIPQWYFIYNNQVGFWPKPSTGGNVITFNYKKKVTDLTVPDISAGGVLTATNGSMVVAGTATAWTPAMAGMYLTVTFSTVANTGDGQHYKISMTPTITATSMSLVTPYKGSNIVTGNAPYTISQLSILPENYQIMPVYYAAAEYWRINGNNIERAQEFERLYQDMLTQFKKDWGTKSANPMVDRGVGEVPIINPNLTITL